MKVLHLSASDIDGGAAIAAYRLHKGLCKIGVDSRMHVGIKSTDDCTVVARSSKLARGWALMTPTIDKLPLVLYPGRKRSFFSTECITNLFDPSAADNIKPRVINLHWICNGYLRTGTIGRIEGPIVWTLHDMWPFTGGCHYSEDCTRYVSSCGQCPQLGSLRSWDISRIVWKYKKRSWRQPTMAIVCPSRWMSECAKSSSLFGEQNVEVIPNGIDHHMFNPVNKTPARDLLSLPQGKKLILFGAMNATSDPRKGFHLLKEMLNFLAADVSRGEVDIVIFGSSQPIIDMPAAFRYHYVGRLKDEISLVLLYSACDVFIAPSVQDNLPNTVMEALSCGTPSVAFKIGGMPDMIEHGVNGYLAQPFDAAELAKGVAWTIQRHDRWLELSRRSREKVQNEFTMEKIATRYARLYEALLKQ